MSQNYTLLQAFQLWIQDKRVSGIKEKSLESDIHRFYVITKHIPASIRLSKITDARIKKVVSDIVATGVSPNTVRGYTATLHAFFAWCERNDLASISVQLYKGVDSVKEIYTKDELMKLLKRPNLNKCTFAEFRNWVIINLLVNNGCRASTIRGIQNRDVILDNSVILLRHTKNRRAQTIPLSPTMIRILAHYMTIRKGNPSDYLFPDVTGEQMSENCLRLAIKRYNLARGVQKTGIHMFRHTFARMYLVECGGDALKLQKLLGHSTLKMTQHYVQLYDTDLVKDYRENSPLEALTPHRIRMPRA